MQVTTEVKVNTVSSQGIQKVLMGIDVSNLSMVAHMFRDQIYSDAKMAVVREYLCNAIDEHQTHKVSRPVEVTLDESSMKFRDFAKGLSNDDVLGIFFQYLSSTKKGEEHGGFGIGAKAGHAYSDIFYVTSHFEGLKTTYAGVLEDNGGIHPDGMINILGSEPSSETGIEVEIPLKNSLDEFTFETKIKQIAKFSKNSFLFNGDLVGGKIPEGWEAFDKYIFCRKKGNQNVSVRLGDIVYKSSKGIYVKGLPDLDLIILADSVNDCALPPSRESVKMDDRTSAFIDGRIEDFKDKLTEHLQEIYDNAASHYERFEIRNTYSLKLDGAAAEAEVLLLSDKVGSVSAFDPYSRKYCNIENLGTNYLVASFYKRSYLFYVGKLSGIKKQYFSLYHANLVGAENARVTFVEFPSKVDGDKWASDLGIPANKYAWAEQVTFPKTSYARNPRVRKIYHYEGINSKGSLQNFDPEEEDVIYVESFKKSLNLKYPEELYRGYNITIVPRYLVSQISDTWVSADSIIEQKLLDLSQKVRDNMADFVKHELASDYDKSHLVRKYFKFKGRKNPLEIPRPITQTDVKLLPLVPERKEVLEIASNVIKKIKTKTDTWQFRAVMALGELSENEYQLAKSKILS